MKKTLLEDALILNVTKTLRFFVHWLPFGVSLFIGRCFGNAVYLLSKRRGIAYRNLRAAFATEKTRKEMKRIVRKSMQTMGLSAMELLRFPDLNERYVREHLEFVGTHKFEPYLREKKGIIFLTAHFGNWEFLNLAANLVGYPLVALARAQKHPRSDEFLNSLRISKGGQVIRKGMPMREILRSLKNGKIVGILSDQDGGRNGTFVRFFNRLSSTPSGVATFALRTGSPIFPVFIFRENNTEHRVEVEGPLAMPDASTDPAEAERMILQQFAEILESKIRKAPDQWLWSHRRWKSTPDRFVLVLSDGKAGHLNQSLAVLDAIKEARAAQGFAAEHTHPKIVEVRFRSRRVEEAFKVLCLLTRGHLPFKVWLLKAVLHESCYETIFKTYADIVVSCGSSLLGVNLLAAYENLAKSVVVMKPPFSPKRFDAVIVPRHDNVKQDSNIFITDRALSHITENYLESEADSLAQELALAPQVKKIGLLVGGDTESIKFSREAFEKVLLGLERHTKDSEVVLLATSSRRTPDWADALLKSIFSKNKQGCPLLVIANESNKNGVMGGILGLCDVVVVTGESISMVSEAVSSGKPVVLFTPWNNAKVKPKLQVFLNRMLDQKLVVLATAENIYETVRSLLECSTGEMNHSYLSRDKEVLMQAAKRVA